VERKPDRILGVDLSRTQAWMHTYVYAPPIFRDILFYL